jgi:hypothetical protein
MKSLNYPGKCPRVPPSRELLLLTDFRGGDTAQHPETFYYYFYHNVAPTELGGFLLINIFYHNAAPMALCGLS